MKTPTTKIDSWPDKLQLLRDYVAAKNSGQDAALERTTAPNAPWRISVRIGDRHWSFELMAAEIVKLREEVAQGLEIPEIFA